ncbi:hypothetical protein [Rhizobacter sp. Root404]|uniref:hypothetical protein n=1 Tax=Rhizobacter sp. Root404 TaxID=1736528 RepID=UPI0006F66AEA|nr:hypothetical protein [Rhizobacter sp. Root404]KQW36935.1 hypothetical protein ASC76_20245 [Rhizobacter sp. Root404]
MPLLDLNRQAITKARAQFAAARDTQRAARAALQQAERELALLQRDGASERTQQRARQRVASLAAKSREQIDGTKAQLRGIVEISEGLRAARDPALMVEALDTQHPVLLMPVAIQTRYDDATTQLMIRIYPDPLHAFQHEPGLTPAEVEAAQRYWTQRFASPQDSSSAWQEIAIPYGPMRAAYLVRMLTPANVGQIGNAAAPDFDLAAVPMASPDAREVVAAVLPERFVAVGFRGGVEVLRKWGAPVADLLPMSPLFDPLLVDDPAQWNPFADDRAWLVDYPAAVAAGMAITVTARDLRRGTTLAQGLDRLVVLGVDWTQTPESGAALVADLLNNHQHAEGLKFVAQATPTNNTGSVRAGFAANGGDVAAALDPTVADAQAEAIGGVAAAAGPGPVVVDELAGAGARLQLLLGLPPAQGIGTFDATLIPGADLQEGATAGHMINALWNATLGYTLRYFWNPLDPNQTLLTDSAIDTLRAHAVRYLRPNGPLAALRVGNQPYGILPITARGFKAEPRSALETELLEAIGWFRGYWESAAQLVPTLSVPAAHQLHQVLAMQPWSVAKQFWQVVGPAAIENYPDIKDLAFGQRMLIQFMVADLLERQPWGMKSPFISGCAVRPKPSSLNAVPWVQRDPANPKQELPADAALARNFVASLLALLRTPNPTLRQPLKAMQNGESLLEAMLGFAADEEVLHSGRQLFYGHLDKSPLVSATAKLAARRMGYSELISVDRTTLVGDQIEIGHAGALLGLQLIGTTGNQSVEAYIGTRLVEAVRNGPEHLRNIATFNESLEFLQARKAGELDLALRGTLDVAAYRLDAWITSLATKRLDQMREATPRGLHIGAWGVVENLKPDSRLPDQRSADSLGYVHAPSIQQATTAAILRSGHLANREAAGGAFDLDLSSARVKRAKRLLEGLSNGQSMAALLGYRFERSLRDHGLSQHILDYRLRYPLKPTGPDDAQGEKISARDVIDGVRLVGEYQSNGRSIDAVSPALVPGADRAKVKPWIDDLIDLMDSVSDLLVAESVHQIVGGNLEAAGAAMATLDKQTRPPEMHVIDTPHSTRGYTQRVVVAMQGGDAGAWAPMNDLAAQLEPRLNAWLARLLGAPARYRFHARVLRKVDTGTVYDGRAQFRWDDTGNPLEASLTELGLSPLALVLGSEAQRAGGQSAVQERLATLLNAKARAAFGAAADQMAIVMQPDAPAGAPAGSVGLVEFESFAWLLKRLLDKTRPLRRMDMVQARDGVETDATLNHGEFAGVQVAELIARMTTADAHADAVEQALQGAVAAAAAVIPPEPDPPESPVVPDPAAPANRALLAQLQAALAQADALGWRSALASQPVADGGAQVAGGDTLIAAHDRAAALLAEVRGRRAAAPAPEATQRFGEQVRKAIARIKAVMGESFPVLPTFDLGGFAAESATSLAARATLLRGDDLAIAGWLPKLGCVHETAGLLSDALTAAEAMGLPQQGGDFKLLQTSAQPGVQVKHWGALPPDPKDDLRGVVAVVAHAPDALTTLGAADTFAGLYVDEWMEAIPAPKETTGLGFHFDAPGARAPQSMLLAVPHDKDLQNWTLDALLGVVDEALALSRVRAVRPADLKGLGLLLPGLFLSNNFKQDVPSVDFGVLVSKNLAALRAAYDQNTAKSFMTMAAGTNVVSE